MKFCKKCVQPDTRPSIKFDEEGICPPCRFIESNEKIDWGSRMKELKGIAQWGREHNVTGYDCIIGVSGGKDSTRQAVFVREELGLNPLLICCSYPPEQLTELGTENLSNLISLGFDCISSSPDPKVWKILMKQGFIKHGNWCKSTEMALYASAPKMSIAYHIPLIFLGENPALMFGDLGVGSMSGDGNKMKYCHTLQGGPEGLLEEGLGITEQDIYWYKYPADEEMEWAKMRIVFLGYYMKDFTSFKNAEFSVARGLRIREDKAENLGECYGFEALDDDFYIINQMFKYFKFGFGKMTDLASEAIRWKLMTRDEAVDLVKKYDGKCGKKYIKRFCDYIGISVSEFWEIADFYRNRNIWEKSPKDKWTLKEVLK